MIAPDVRIDVRPVFADVHAVRTLETRLLTTLVLVMPYHVATVFVAAITHRARMTVPIIVIVSSLRALANAGAAVRRPI